jgi:Flp pilus assembly protein TadG
VAERGDLHRESGQATVELVAALPALLLAALISLQLLAAGYALTLADGAAEAGALALAEGGSAAYAARAALPGWADDDVSVSVAGDEVSVRLRPPSPFGQVADHLVVTSTASARAAE